MKWPTDIREPASVDEQIIKEVIRNEFSSGYVQSRPKWTRSRKKFTLNWSSGMSAIEKETLETFFKNNIGNSFDWTNPLDDVTYTVLFSDDNIKFNFAAKGAFTCTINLEEK